jgi:hypothetical protein
MENDKRVRLRAYSMGELAGLYKVHRDTMRKWLIPFAAVIGERNGRFYSIIQVQIIFERLGWPELDDDE